MTCKSIWSESISIHLLRSSHRKLFKFLKSSQLVMNSQWTNKGKLVNEMVPSASNGTILDIIHSLLKIIKTVYENSCIRARVRIRSGRLLLYSFMSWRKVIEKIERTYWPRKKCRIEIVNEETRRFLSLYFLAFSSIFKSSKWWRVVPLLLDTTSITKLHIVNFLRCVRNRQVLHLTGTIKGIYTTKGLKL